MKKKRKANYYAKSTGTGSIAPIRTGQTAKTGYSIEDPLYPGKKDRVDKEEQKKFLSALGGAFKKRKEEEAEQKRIEEEEAERRIERERKLKKMPKMIVPDLGPDFRHEVKLQQSEEQKMEQLRKMAQRRQKM